MELGWSKDSAPGCRCAVPARPPGRVRGGPGGGPHGGAVVPGEALRWEDLLPPARIEGCSGGTAERSPRARGGRGAAGVRGSLMQSPRGRSAVGPYAERRPLARGRRTEAGSRGEPGGGAVVPGAASHVQAGEAAPPGAGAERPARGSGSYLPGSRG